MSKQAEISPGNYVPSGRAAAIIILAVVAAIVANFVAGYFLRLWLVDRDTLLEREVKELETIVQQQAGSPNPDKLVALGAGYYKLGKYDKAKEVLSTALKIDKNNLTARYNLGLVYLADEDYPMAVAELKKVVVQSGRNFPSHLNLGIAYLNMKDYNNAQYFLNKALEIEPVSNEARLYLGKAYEGLGDKKKAKYYYQAALSRDPMYAEAKEALAALK